MPPLRIPDRAEGEPVNPWHKVWLRVDHGCQLHRLCSDCGCSCMLPEKHKDWSWLVFEGHRCGEIYIYYVVSTTKFTTTGQGWSWSCASMWEGGDHGVLAWMGIWAMLHHHCPGCWWLRLCQLLAAMSSVCSLSHLCGCHVCVVIMFVWLSWHPCHCQVFCVPIVPSMWPLYYYYLHCAV